MRAYAAWFGSDSFKREDGGTKFLRNIVENVLLVTYCTEPLNLCPSREWISDPLVKIDMYSVLL